MSRESSLESGDIRKDRVHQPVLFRESLELLSCRAGGFYVDCTLGMGGHAEGILRASAPDGRLLALDKDEQAIRFAQQRLAPYGDRLKTVHEDYRMLRATLERSQLQAPNGILADLGPSLLQFTSPERGFSFQEDGPLDMRMDQHQDLTAGQIVNQSSAAELRRILKEFGEENSASAIANRIVNVRQKNPIHTTTELARLIESVKPRRHTDRIHPATKTFQALRIAVNRELEGLDQFLFDAFDALAAQGRLVVISFHSLEDRIVKRVFRFLSAACRCSKNFLQCICGGKPLSKMLTDKPVTASEEEVNGNPASRSAKLRAIEKADGSAPREFWTQWLEERS